MPEPDEPLDGALRRIAREIDEDDVDARLAWQAFARDVLQREEPQVAIGRFELRARIGAGSFGRVYAAWDPRLQRTVALKLHQRELLPDRLRDQFLREAQALAQLAHPNVVQVFGFGESRHGLYFAMEHVEGPSLHAWQAVGDRRWRDVVRMHAQLADGIAATHAVGFVHADVKPTNVVVTASGRPCLVDFGLVGMRAVPELASFDDAGANSTLVVGGTPGYAAPEQLVHGRVDARSDQFSFCVGLYEGLAGARPFTVQVIAALGRGELVAAREYRAIGGVPRRLDRVLARGLHEDPAQRYPSMAALAEALRGTIGRGPHAAYVLGSLFVLGAGLLALGEADRCPEVDHDHGHEQLAATLRRDGADPEAVAGVLASLEAQHSRWTEIRAQVCATQPVDALAFDRAMSCLRRGAGAHRSFVRALIEHPEARARLDGLRAELDDPAHCVAPSVRDHDTRAIAVLETLDRGRIELAAGQALA
ncbi:MAG: serine/threonine protein kinase, partial [Deltaproteobacteria bacterium]|nr:serine/threonine protein kinase [Nannocystaceae bacterium]